ncbi:MULTISPECIES: hypothetical protein [Streptomyces]|uniref:Uncharacterized protein n=1 Tax=Streptomyces glycanivorans TaxID=3033808 RepID=A0ABY9J8B5_9ACTN|nr:MULTISPECIES: hypothetical protein [unclassified Streptomyces]WSQ77296.1 hypothetical protein OG725_09370 [Streptomyces sp. NBC_01213]TXS18273.1 hypothetical protein EAO68_11580 [Streptomyces sp. wa22]WLQ63908.1 hypothetical protein P8A20_10005 [Streptomyces sp. Alt3]WSQ84627.1 hypothetical protein OG722_09810 [Streptomyces sp. NBC_01212]WSR09260.1 hypothetical protein OG265_26065 [Streptomyces sp. NBC_01208]
MRDAIDAVDWSAVPGHPDWYEPEHASRGLRALADAVHLVRAAEAGSLLGGGGIVHGHSGAVFPAAAVAAPLLLDIVQHGHPAAGETALGLLDEALSFRPRPGYTRVLPPHGAAVPICCVIADHVRARTAPLSRMGSTGKALLADAAEHWRFDVRESVADGDDTAAFGSLAGRFPDDVGAVELNVAGEFTVLDRVGLEYAPQEGSAEACLRVGGLLPGDLPPGAILYPAGCGL